ncbi:6-phospho-3-hexuloisomerase [Exiguobacterium sp. s193]|uniref:6-phospho-3-hexuloisomerase n=1 Tax=Exiguobacterium sp. s193 TaxID=2751207 RepID=UPI001BE647F6|nr:6-phospho-3-hexuloisomerase [Exiguobacterium sp. s193]
MTPIQTILQELTSTVEAIDQAETTQLAEAVLKADRIFLAGAGRSGLMGKAFVMRLMHMGLDAYVVGETVTANLREGDLLIIGSGSGETKTLVPIVEKAKQLGGTVAVVTIEPTSTLAKLADLTVKLPGVPKERTAKADETVQPMGSLFEQTMLLFYDALILHIMAAKQLDSKTMYGKHANLE